VLFLLPDLVNLAKRFDGDDPGSDDESKMRHLRTLAATVPEER